MSLFKVPKAVLKSNGNLFGEFSNAYSDFRSSSRYCGAFPNHGGSSFWDLMETVFFRVKGCSKGLLGRYALCLNLVPVQMGPAIPIKVNVLAWKISMDRLPTRVNLHRRGVHFPLFLSQICCEALENLDHLLFVGLGKDIARFNQVQNKCWKECFTLPGGVSGHIETISSSLIQIFEKMVFLKT
ncbi:RNA-directed DNA polymerase, eukaryota [Tanacetum coccineum]